MGRKRIRRTKRGCHIPARGLVYLSLVGVAAYLSTLFYNVLTRSPYFEIKEITLVGGMKVDAQRLAEEAGLRTGQNILSLDLKEIKRRMETFPWVKRVAIQRLFPNRLRIEIKERVPLALLYLNGRIYIMDEDGFPFKEATASDGVDLPVVTGIMVETKPSTSQPTAEGSRLETKPSTSQPTAEGSKGEEWEERRVEVVKILKELRRSIERSGRLSYQDISEVRVEGEDVTIYTTDGKEIFLGRGGFMKKMERLGKLIAFIGRDYKRVGFVNLDYTDRAVVRYRNLSERG